MPQGKISNSKTRIAITIPKDLKLKAEIIANQENRSFSNLVVTLLDDYVKINEQRERLLKYHELLSNIKNDDAK